MVPSGGCANLGDVVFPSLLEVERVIRAGWSSETCDPLALDEWSPETPARGQCAVTALIVQELFGGELLLAEVHYPDGSRQGLHYWNRLGNGLELDLTREQFLESETVQAPVPVDRPADLTRGRLFPQYRALAALVRSGLAAATPRDAARTGGPASGPATAGARGA